METNSQRLLSAGDTCRLLGTTTQAGTFPHATLNNWVKQGIIRPVVGGRGTGNHRVFRLLPDVLALAVARGLRGRGFSPTAAANVAERILDHDASTLADLFAKGRGCLIVVREQVAPRFLTQQDVLEILQGNPLEAADWVRVHPVAVNVGDVYAKMIAMLDSMKTNDAVLQPSLN